MPVFAGADVQAPGFRRFAHLDPHNPVEDHRTGIVVQKQDITAFPKDQRGFACRGSGLRALSNCCSVSARTIVLAKRSMPKVFQGLREWFIVAS